MLRQLPTWLLMVICLGLSTGCASNAAIKAYATTAEEHANVLQLTFERCLKEENPVVKEAICQAVRSSIQAYRQSAAELRHIKGN